MGAPWQPSPWRTWTCQTGEHHDQGCPPSGKTLSSDELWHLGAAINDADLAIESSKSLCNNSLVLDRVHRAGRVDETATVTKLIETSDEDLELKSVKTDGIVGSPLLPDGDVLADGTVTRAGDIGKIRSYFMAV